MKFATDSIIFRSNINFFLRASASQAKRARERIDSRGAAETPEDLSFFLCTICVLCGVKCMQIISASSYFSDDYLVSIRKRHLAPDFRVGRRIRILKIFDIFLRFESAGRLELGRNLPFAFLGD